MKLGTITAMARPSDYGHKTYRRGGVDWPVIDVGSGQAAKTVDVFEEPTDGALLLSGVDAILNDARMIVEGNAFVLNRLASLGIAHGDGCAVVKPGALTGLSAHPSELAGRVEPKPVVVPQFDRAALLARAEKLGIENADEMADAILAEAIENAETLANRSKGRKAKSDDGSDDAPKRGRRKKDAGD